MSTIIKVEEYDSDCSTVSSELSKAKSVVSFADLQPAKRKSRSEEKTVRRKSTSQSQSPPSARLQSPQPGPSTCRKIRPKKKKISKKSSTFLSTPSDGKEKRRNNRWERVGPQFHTQADFEDSKEFREIM